MKQVVLFLISLFYFASISAQITEKDHEKYWHYRNRLRTYYMHVGEGPGASIPAGIRNFINWETGEPSIIHWGDATLYLGWYMGVLATEYHLLNKNNQETKEILEELNYALLAVERLDSIAELRWDLPSSVNGFLIRDDIPENFLELHPHLNHNLNDKIFYNEKSGQALKVRQVVSDFIINPHNAFSQDQLVHLLMGLVLAAKFSPSQIFSLDVDVNGGIVNYKINPKEKAIFLTDKLVEYASNITGKEPWQLRYPTGETISNSRGGDLRANATAI
ncbi:MAG: hypothetical protein H0U27_05810, partial [Nitrosopumilus sp.]|nr:hypothetical protein [Nitrosopumilus sp.]